MFPEGMRQSSRITSAVWLARTPILSSTFPALGQGRVDTTSTVRLRDERRVQAEGVRLPNDFPWDRPLAVVLQCEGPHFSFGELMRGLLHEPLFVREFEIDHGLLPVAARVGP